MKTVRTQCVPLSSGHVVLSKNFNGPGECIHKGFYGSGYMTLYATPCTYERVNGNMDEVPLAENVRIRVQVGEEMKTFVVNFQPANITNASPFLKNVHVAAEEEVWAAIENHRNEFIVHGFVSSEPVT